MKRSRRKLASWPACRPEFLLFALFSNKPAFSDNAGWYDGKNGAGGSDDGQQHDFVKSDGWHHGDAGLIGDGHAGRSRQDRA